MGNRLKKMLVPERHSFTLDLKPYTSYPVFYLTLGVILSRFASPVSRLDILPDFVKFFLGYLSAGIALFQNINRGLTHESIFVP